MYKKDKAAHNKLVQKIYNSNLTVYKLGDGTLGEWNAVAN